MRAAKSLGLCLVLLTACANDDRPPVSTGPVALDQFNVQFRHAMCRAILNCPQSQSERTYAALFGTEDECVRILEGGDSAYAAEIARAQAGLLTYDADKAGACLARITCGSIGNERFLDSVCENVFGNAAPPNGNCATVEDCGLHETCEGATGTCNGTCTAQPPAALGQDCTHAFCDSGDGTQLVTCEYVSESSYVCKAYDYQVVAAGESCASTETGTTFTDRTCAAGTYCNSDNVCATAKALGASCNRAEECGLDAFCTDNGSASTCAAYTIANSVGAPCSGDGTVAACNPFRRLRCTEAGTCEQLGTGVAGDACERTPDGSAFDIGCAEGFYCDSTSLHCVALLANGAPCQYGWDCASQSCNEGAAGSTCGAPPPPLCSM